MPRLKGQRSAGGGVASPTPPAPGALEVGPPASGPAPRRGPSRAVAVALLVFVAVVVVFIVQNLHHVRVTFITAHWSAPLAVDLLLATMLGGAVVATLGAVRTFRLWRGARRHQRARGV